MLQDGILIVDKPSGMTSHDVVQKLRRAYKIKKVGHTGTLDPMVTGVMVVCFGKATKLSQFLTNESKEYAVGIKLGIATDTEDITGKVTESKTIRETESANIEKQVPEILSSFVGEYLQTPPMYSAVKIDGKKLYEYARADIEVERIQRKLTVESIMLDKQSFIYDSINQTLEFDFIVTASKGLYARTLCVDIGKKLGVPATMSQLRRLQSGSYELKQALKLEQIIEEQPPLISIDKVTLPLKKVVVSTDIAAKLRVGYKLPHYFVEELIADNEQFAVYDQQTAELIGIYQQSEKYEDKYSSVRVM